MFLQSSGIATSIPQSQNTTISTPLVRTVTWPNSPNSRCRSVLGRFLVGLTQLATSGTPNDDNKDYHNHHHHHNHNNNKNKARVNNFINSGGLTKQNPKITLLY